MQSPSTDIQPSTSTNQAVEDLVRACMSSITPIIETTCRRVIEEKLSTAEIPVPQTIASSDPPPVVPTTDRSVSVFPVLTGCIVCPLPLAVAFLTPSVRQKRQDFRSPIEGMQV